MLFCRSKSVTINEITLSYSQNNEAPYLAYASGKDIIVANPLVLLNSFTKLQTVKVTQVLQDHQEEINCLTLVPNQQNGYLHSLMDFQEEMISCGCDGVVVSWKRDEVREENGNNPQNGNWTSFQKWNIGELIGRYGL